MRRGRWRGRPAPGTGGRCARRGERGVVGRGLLLCIAFRLQAVGATFPTVGVYAAAPTTTAILPAPVSSPCWLNFVNCGDYHTYFTMFSFSCHFAIFGTLAYV
jgi:hypothetical protein